MQHQSASVPARAQQAEEAMSIGALRSRWPWVEASVWTDRMLAALESPSKGGVWFRLIDKVYSLKNLRSAWSKTARNKGAAGVDGVTTDRYERDVEDNLQSLAEQL